MVLSLVFISGRSRKRQNSLNFFERWEKLSYFICMLIHRGLKLDGAIGQGEICNFLKSEIFSKCFLLHIGKNK